MQRGYFNMGRNRLTTSHNQPHHQPNYSLTPDPSPNGEGSENHCLQIKESLTPNPSPNGEGSENHCLQIKESLTPNPSPNGEGSDDYCLQIKGAFRWCEERLSS